MTSESNIFHHQVLSLMERNENFINEIYFNKKRKIVGFYFEWKCEIYWPLQQFDKLMSMDKN